MFSVIKIIAIASIWFKKATALPKLLKNDSESYIKEQVKNRS